jgi:hypothetical protein
LYEPDELQEHESFETPLALRKYAVSPKNP